MTSRALRMSCSAVAVIICLLARPVRAESEMREFMMSCTYGVLAGTLVGAASLAFTDQPGENLNRVARGASIGLYAGILLGLYVVYIVPGQIESQQREQLEEARLRDFRFNLYPLMVENKLDGVAATYDIFRF